MMLKQQQPAIEILYHNFIINKTLRDRIRSFGQVPKWGGMTEFGQTAKKVLSVQCKIYPVGLEWGPGTLYFPDIKIPFLMLTLL